MDSDTKERRPPDVSEQLVWRAAFNWYTPMLAHLAQIIILALVSKGQTLMRANTLLLAYFNSDWISLSLLC